MAKAADEVGQPIVDLKDYLRAIAARKIQVTLVTLVVVGAVVALTLHQTPTYFAQAKVLVLPPVNISLSTVPINPGLLQPVMTTESELVRSEAVTTKVSGSLEAPVSTRALLSGLKVAAIPDSSILLIGYVDPSPQRAAAVANAFARAYIEVRRASLISGFTNALQPINQQISIFKAKVADLRRRIDSAVDPGEQQRLKLYKQSFVSDKLLPLKTEALQLQTAASASRAGQVVQSAHAPLSPSSPNTVTNVGLSIFGGLALGMVIALVRDAMDRGVRSREELERLMGAPVLAVVPRVPKWRAAERPMMMSEPGSRNAATEAYGTLATNVRYGGSEYLLKVVTVTSAFPGEGKTVTTVNLAIALAQAQYQVVIVSADLRRPRIQKFFDLDDVRGLTDAVNGEASLSEVINLTPVPMLSVIPSGPLPDNPVAFLARLKASRILSDLREMCDLVICDAPPVLPVADAAVLASMSDGVVFVHSPSKSSRQALAESRDRLRVAGARIVGVVYNNVDVRGRGKYYGAYSGPYLDDRRNGKR